jgi:fatty acid kinase
VLEVLDAAAVRRWGRASLDGLGHAREEIDALNVYPVPDGDTGTNLFLTLESAVEAMGHGSPRPALADRDDAFEPSDDPAEAQADLVRTARAMAHGALMGARGNSGVIVSQMLRGMAEVLASSPEAGPGQAAESAAETLRRALSRASELGYAAVAEPVEGTVLTVMRAAAEAAQAVPGTRMSPVARAAARAAREALARTPDQLEVLRRAGVVDAGGRGLVVILDALVGTVTGALPPPMPRAARPHRPPPPVPDVLTPEGPSYEVMYLLRADEAAIPSLRSALLPLGDSLLVVGGEDLWNVHVHVDDVGAAIEAGIEAGRPFRIQVTHFRDQVARQRAAHPEGAERAVVALAGGGGLADLLRESGAVVVQGAGGLRPATREILDGIRAAGTPEVVVLPHDKDSVPSAEAAAEQARSDGLRVQVLPTRASVQVLAALAVHDPQRRFDDDVVSMTAAARATRYGGVTTAVREALTTAGVCHPGDQLGVVSGDVAVIGSDLHEVAVEVLDRLLSGGGELVTLVTGADAPAGLVDHVLDHLRTAHPESDTAVYSGGQRHYPLLFGVE